MLYVSGVCTICARVPVSGLKLRRSHPQTAYIESLRRAGVVRRVVPDIQFT